MTEYQIIGAIVVWWTVAVVVFSNAFDTENDILYVITLAVFWPAFAVMGMTIVLWRIPFKSTKAIKVDLYNRKLMREFERWLDERKGGDQ